MNGFDLVTIHYMDIPITSFTTPIPAPPILSPSAPRHRNTNLFTRSLEV